MCFQNGQIKPGPAIAARRHATARKKGGRRGNIATTKERRAPVSCAIEQLAKACQSRKVPSRATISRPSECVRLGSEGPDSGGLAVSLSLSPPLQRKAALAWKRRKVPRGTHRGPPFSIDRRCGMREWNRAPWTSGTWGHNSNGPTSPNGGALLCLVCPAWPYRRAARGALPPIAKRLRLVCEVVPTWTRRAENVLGGRGRTAGRQAGQAQVAHKAGPGVGLG